MSRHYSELTAFDIRALPAGPETDAIVGEVVLKYFVRSPDNDNHPGFESTHVIHWWEPGWVTHGGCSFLRRVPHGMEPGSQYYCLPYTTKTSAARRALREYLTCVIREPDHHFTILKFTTRWRFGLDTPWSPDTCPGRFDRFPEADTEALAICLGLLLHASGMWVTDPWPAPEPELIRCRKCNRVLTHPLSTESGLGPCCAAHIGRSVAAEGEL
jgi:hypothetical protein